MFDRLRRKRNLALYGNTGFVSRRDAEQAIESARHLRVLRSAGFPVAAWSGLQWN